MDKPGEPDLREQVDRALRNLAGRPTGDDMSRAKALMRAARDAREFEPMGRLAETISRHDPHDAKTRGLYGQYLIETGKATAAIDVLRRVLQRLPKADPEHAEVAGLIGRAYKQIFADLDDKTDSSARHALTQAIKFYRGPFEDNPKANTWHGVNLAALLNRARQLGLSIASGLEPRDIASRVVAELTSLNEDERKSHEWFRPTLAEAYLGIGDWDRMEETIGLYASVSVQTPAFLLTSTLRQLTEVWDLEQSGDRGRALVEILRARLAMTPEGVVDLTPEQLLTLQHQKDPDKGQVQAMLGPHGLATYPWWETGRERALSVASISTNLGSRMATGFLVRAGDLRLEPADELVLLTNYHVVNDNGEDMALTPRDTVVVFEAGAPNNRFLADKILWSSPTNALDAAILRLRPTVTGLQPLPIAPQLPRPGGRSRKVFVYAIGHPWGRELCFSFRGNELIDHEGPPEGNPAIVERRRVHYRATTEVGSSGSPVFNATHWEVIALHRAGHRSRMPKLNQKPGRYGANEGIAMQSIVEAPKPPT